MKPIEIIVIIVSVLIVTSVIGSYIYKRIKHMPTGDCACCNARKGAQGLKDYYYKHKDDVKCNCSK